jgi:hypothetical protein
MTTNKTRICPSCGEYKNFNEQSIYCKDCSCPRKRRWYKLYPNEPYPFTHKGWGYKNKSHKKPRRPSVCVIIKNHHNEMANDPEHLSTKFIQSMVGKKCKM